MRGGDGRPGAPRQGGLERRGHVVDLQGDRLDAVAVPHQALGVGVIAAERRGEHERDVPLAEHVTRLVPHAGLEPRVGDHLEAERVAIEVGGLPRIAHEHPHVVDALERHCVGGRRHD